MSQSDDERQAGSFTPGDHDGDPSAQSDSAGAFKPGQGASGPTFDQPISGQPIQGQPYVGQPYGAPGTQPYATPGTPPYLAPGAQPGAQPFGAPGTQPYSAPLVGPYPFAGPSYMPLDPDLPPRGTINPFRAFPKVLSRLLSQDTANGFAWAFAAKHYGWTVILTFAVIAGAVSALFGAIGVPKFLAGENLPLKFGLSGFLVTLLQGVLFACGVSFSLNWRNNKVKHSFSDAVTIWGTAFTVQGLALTAYGLIVSLCFRILWNTGWNTTNGSLSTNLMVLGLASLAVTVSVGWGYVIAYQGQRWFSGSPEAFTGRWIMVLAAVFIIFSIATQLINTLLGLSAGSWLFGGF